LSDKKVIIIGHMGANNIAPENTLKAFQKAIELSADYIEFDIHESKDGEIVVMHDINTLRTTGHNGEIRDMTLKELKSLDCGEGEQIPTLQEVIELSKDKIKLQIEVKVSGFTEKLVKILREKDLIDTSLISSFMFIELLNLRKLESNLKVGLLVPEFIRLPQRIIKLIKKVIKYNFYSIHLFHGVIDNEILKVAHENNLKVIAWTVNSKIKMKNLINMGVDGLITDDIQRAKDLLNRE